MTTHERAMRAAEEIHSLSAKIGITNALAQFQMASIIERVVIAPVIEAIADAREFLDEGAPINSVASGCNEGIRETCDRIESALSAIAALKEQAQ